MNRWILGAIVAALCIPAQVFAAAKDEKDNSVSGSEEAFARLREIQQPSEPAFSVEDAIKKFFPDDAEVDEGTYPLSEASEHDFDLRRKKPEQPSYSGRLFGRYSDDSISGVTKWEKELELNLAYKDWTGYFRFSDFNTFAKDNDPFKWEKGSLRYRHGDSKITVGSFGALFGRGLALNMYEDRVVEHDNEVEGIKVEEQVGDAEITALAGRRKLKDTVAVSEVKAARVEFPLGTDADLGVHAVDVKFPDPNAAVDPVPTLNYKIIGADFSAHAGDLSLFAEVANLNRGTVASGSPYDTDGKNGNGYYINTTYSRPGFSLTGEYKHYDALAQPFNVAPAVKRWFENSSADLNNEEGWASEMAVDLLGDGSQFTFRYGQSNTLEGGLPHHEFYGNYTSKTQGDFGWIGEWWEVNKYGDKHSLQRFTGNEVLNDDWTSTGSIEREHIKPSFGDSYIDYIYIAELAYQSKFNINFLYETTGQEKPDVETAWRTWEFRYRPDDEQEFNLVAGTRRDGFVCSGGVCRLEPAFNGVKIDYLLKF